MVEGDNRWGRYTRIYEKFVGIVADLERRYRESTSDDVKGEIEKYMRELVCGACNGSGIKPESLTGNNPGPIYLCCYFSYTVTQVRSGSPLNNTLNAVSDRENEIANLIITEIEHRLMFLNSVGLEYITLDREAGSLSGGEAQRIRLASQIGSGLTGVLYVLDEPTIGLHQRDNKKLIGTLKKLRDLGNTVIVVEHDREMIGSADHVVDFGPGAGDVLNVPCGPRSVCQRRQRRHHAAHQRRRLAGRRSRCARRYAGIGRSERAGARRSGQTRRAYADLVLFVTDSPLRDFEFELLRQLADMEKRVIVCLNKEDWFTTVNRELLLEQLQSQVSRWIPAENVVAVQARPAARRAARVMADGKECEEEVPVEPDISDLAKRMRSIIKSEGPSPLLANLLLQSRGLVSEAKAQVQTALDDRASAAVDRAMCKWGPRPPCRRYRSSTSRRVWESLRTWCSSWLPSIERESIWTRSAGCSASWVNNCSRSVDASGGASGGQRHRVAVKVRSRCRHSHWRCAAGPGSGSRHPLDRQGLHRLFPQRDATGRARLGQLGAAPMGRSHSAGGIGPLGDSGAKRLISTESPQKQP